MSGLRCGEIWMIVMTCRLLLSHDDFFYLFGMSADLSLFFLSSCRDSFRFRALLQGSAERPNWTRRVTRERMGSERNDLDRGKSRLRRFTIRSSADRMRGLFWFGRSQIDCVRLFMLRWWGWTEVRRWWRVERRRMYVAMGCERERRRYITAGKNKNKKVAKGSEVKLKEEKKKVKSSLWSALLFLLSSVWSFFLIRFLVWWCVPSLIFFFLLFVPDLLVMWYLFWLARVIAILKIRRQNLSSHSTPICGLGNGRGGMEHNLSDLQ